MSWATRVKILDFHGYITSGSLIHDYLQTKMSDQALSRFSEPVGPPPTETASLLVGLPSGPATISMSASLWPWGPLNVMMA